MTRIKVHVPDENDLAVAGRLPERWTDGTVETDHSVVIALDPKMALQSMQRDPKGLYLKNAMNVALYLVGAQDWRGTIGVNTLSNDLVWVGKPPVTKGLHRPVVGQALADADYSMIAGALAPVWGGKVLDDGVAFAGARLAGRNYHFNPLQDYLNGIAWDGRARLGSWLSTYLGCEPSDYVHRVGRWWLISAVARALSPGVQADHMLVLEGSQGAGKSSALRVLGGDWHLGSLPNLRDPKGAVEAMLGHWIVEIAELDALKGSAETRVKDFLTQVRDVYRVPYARVKQTLHRSQVFAGTTNEDQYLTDPTGPRRYWPVKVGRIDVDALREDRDVLLAEAVSAYRGGATWWPTAEAREVLRGEQVKRQEVDVWTDRVVDWAEDRDEFSIAGVLGDALGIDPGKQTRGDQMRASAILRRAGYVRVMHGTRGKRRWVYTRSGHDDED